MKLHLIIEKVAIPGLTSSEMRLFREVIRSPRTRHRSLNWWASLVNSPKISSAWRDKSDNWDITPLRVLFVTISNSLIPFSGSCLFRAFSIVNFLWSCVVLLNYLVLKLSKERSLRRKATVSLELEYGLYFKSFK